MNDSIDWSELSLQIMISFAHFMWQGCVVAILLLLAEQLSAIASRSIPAPDRCSVPLEQPKLAIRLPVWPSSHFLFA